MKLLPTLLAIMLVGAVSARAKLIPGDQLIVSVAPGWNSTVGKLQLFQRQGNSWVAASPPIRVLYGKNGLAWGRGEFPPQEGLQKQERDKRAPAGVFRVGTIYTSDTALPEGASYPFHTITAYDAWVDDPTNPNYNRHVAVDPANIPPWFEKQKMRENDQAHRWLVEIRHNTDPPVPGDGSAIFFHIQRGSDIPSAGCTVMPSTALAGLIRWLRADQRPYYVLLPKGAYLELWSKWGLPSPDVAANLLNM